jgi:hypothetical protein
VPSSILGTAGKIHQKSGSQKGQKNSSQSYSSQKLSQNHESGEIRNNPEERVMAVQQSYMVGSDFGEDHFQNIEGLDIQDRNEPLQNINFSNSNNSIQIHFEKQANKNRIKNNSKNILGSLKGKGVA